MMDYPGFKFGILQIRRLGFNKNLVISGMKCYIVGYLEPNDFRIENNDNHPLWGPYE